MVGVSAAFNTETNIRESNYVGYTRYTKSNIDIRNGYEGSSGEHTEDDSSKSEMWVTLQALTAFLVIITVMAFAFILRPILQANVVAHREEYAPV